MLRRLDLGDSLPAWESLLDLQIEAVQRRAKSRAYDKKEEGRERVDDSSPDVSRAGRIRTAEALWNRPNQETDEERRRVGEFSHQTENEADSDRDCENPRRIDEESSIRGCCRCPEGEPSRKPSGLSTCRHYWRNSVDGGRQELQCAVYQPEHSEEHSQDDFKRVDVSDEPVV